jgi:hypothetical protein
MRSKLTVMLLVVALVSLIAWNGHGKTETPGSAMYEYQVIYDPTETNGQEEGVKKLNELGRQGWEIVGTSKAGNSYPRLYLKRTIR